MHVPVRLEELEKERAAEEESINIEASTKIKESREGNRSIDAVLTISALMDVKYAFRAPGDVCANWIGRDGNIAVICLFASICGVLVTS